MFRHVIVSVFLLLSVVLHTVEGWGFGRKSNPNQPTTTTPAPRVQYPVHPRVNINWTDLHLKSNLTKTERKEIIKNKLVLTKLVVINRHGHRAPNAPYWHMCPNDKANKKVYTVDAEDLSALGMEEEVEFGTYIRNTYHEFLGDRFNRTLHHFRSVGEHRILQSAMAVASGIFPDGFGPGGFMPSRPQFVPIFSDMDTHEYLLDDVPCFKRAEADSHRWIEENWKPFIEEPENAEALQIIQRVCGNYSGEHNYKYVKTVADGMTFNSDLGLKIGKGKNRLKSEELFKIRKLSYSLLLQRLYNTDEQQTYTVVDLPRTILQLFNHTHTAANSTEVNDFRDTRHESSFYFVHRESLYALAQFFGFRYEVPGLPPGEVPVASSLIIEKLMPKEDQFSHDEEKVFLRFTLWTPNNGIITVPLSKCRIPELCEMAEVRKIYDDRIARTGDWEKLCNYTPQEIDHTTDIR